MEDDILLCVGVDANVVIVIVLGVNGDLLFWSSSEAENPHDHSTHVNSLFTSLFLNLGKP